MGAEFNFMTIKGTRDKAKAHFNAVRETSLYEQGYSYSGGWGMASGLTFHDKVFDDENAAEEYLVDNAEKWENAIAVQFKESDGSLSFAIGAWCSS